MPTSHPYISGPGNITKLVNQLRKSFPSVVDSSTVKKLGLASNNESFLINILQFIGVIDLENKRSEKSSKIFNLHNDEEFCKAFSGLVKSAYSALFDLHGDASWTLSTDELITFFRQNDQTGEAIGKRQANTFKTLSAISGYLESIEPIIKKNTAIKTKVVKPTKETKSKAIIDDLNAGKQKNSEIGLSVRIEINLPADGTKETYDNIFKSIRENLLNG